MQGLDRHTKDSAYYSEIIPSAFSFENRTEFHINFDIPFGGGGSGGEPDDGKKAKAAVPQSSPALVLGNKINFGIDFHYQEVTAFDDYFDEPLNAWNLATSRNFIHYVNFSTFTALPIPNNPGWTGTPGVYNNDTNYSKVFTVAPFYEHVFDFGEHFSLLAGVRADVVWVKVNDPYDHLEAKIALLNLTNQKLWGPPDPVYGYDSVVAEWRFQVEGTITIKF